MRRPHLLLHVLLPILTLGLGSCAPTVEVASEEWAIVNGERTNMNEPAVVIVVNRLGGLCSGSLIAPRVVLTAKHCVQGAGASAPNDPAVFAIGVGDSIRGLSATFNAASIWTTPGAYANDGRLTGLVGIDVALITLQREATGVTPLNVYRGHPREVLGQPVRAVGFGQTPAGSTGVKYRVTTQINSIDGSILGTPPATCQGDSGGPLITEDNHVVGVTSFGTGSCGGGGFNGYNRVDIFLEDIDRVLMETGICTGSAVEICNGMDDDCDDEVDEGCQELGEECSNDDECVSGRCEDTPTGMLCTTDCDPLRPYLGCAPGMYCAQTAGCEGRCLPGAAGTGANGSTCTEDTDCESLFCASLLGELRCLSSCRGGENMCFDGEDCAAPAGGCGVCTGENTFAEPAGLGEACTDDAGCSSGTCLTELSDSYCSASCSDDSECPATFHCRNDANICIRGARGSVGGSCAENGDCAPSLFCASQGDASWCTQFCDVPTDCPENFTCLAVGEQSICAPDLGIAGADCSSAAECISGVCEPVGADGATVCSRMCSSDAPCETGLVCRRSGDSAEGLCVAPTVPPGTTPPGTVPFEPGGGGCATSPNQGSPLLLVLMVMLGGLGARRRWRF